MEAGVGVVPSREGGNRVVGGDGWAGVRWSFGDNWDCDLQVRILFGGERIFFAFLYTFDVNFNETNNNLSM